MKPVLIFGLVAALAVAGPVAAKGQRHGGGHGGHGGGHHKATDDGGMMKSPDLGVGSGVGLGGGKGTGQGAPMAMSGGYSMAGQTLRTDGATGHPASHGHPRAY